jgi:hypothetical protein
MRSLKYVASVALTVSASSLAACGGGDESAQTGVLVVPFELGNGRTCEELGIVAVRGELGEGDFVEEVECDAGELRFTSLEAGRYQVTLYGLDEDEVPVMDSLEDGPQPIQVVGENTTVVFDPPLGLTSAPARLSLRWTFGFSTCESASIDGFAIAAWRADGSALLMEADVPCGTAGEGRDQYRAVPDLDRELSGSEVGEVEIQPHDQQGFEIGDAITFKFDAPGPGADIKLSLTCDEAGCEGTGQPD